MARASRCGSTTRATVRSTAPRVARASQRWAVRPRPGAGSRRPHRSASSSAPAYVAARVAGIGRELGQLVVGSMTRTQGRGCRPGGGMPGSTQIALGYAPAMTRLRARAGRSPTGSYAGYGAQWVAVRRRPSPPVVEEGRSPVSKPPQPRSRPQLRRCGFETVAAQPPQPPRGASPIVTCSVTFNPCG